MGALVVVAAILLFLYFGLWLLEIALRLIIAVGAVAIWLPLALLGLLTTAVDRAMDRA